MRTPNCAQTRSVLLQGETDDRIGSREVAEHLESCAACSEFARRARLAVDALGARASTVIADAGFSARVVRALPKAEEDYLGWAALRLLPAALALSLVLGAWCWSATGTPATLLEESPTDDLIGWVLDEESDES